MMSSLGNSPPNTRNASHGPDERDRQHDRVRDAQPGARQQVVGQRVAGEPVGDGRAAAGVTPIIQLISRGRRNAPVKKMRRRCTTIARDEQQRGPVVDLAHHQAGAHVEADVAALDSYAADMRTPCSGA